jgi:hypothetical protein
MAMQPDPYDQPEVADAQRESGLPGGGVGRKEEVGGSGVYPASAGRAPVGARIRTQAEWGRGERGAATSQGSASDELIQPHAQTDAAEVELSAPGISAIRRIENPG